ncbi:hypothetical protein GCK32_008907 [Trichostrongylus colubriformis]|uniref:CHHC U11-48K-type domain-containing protein n=1 Tax=Trichostrongylus colubriformis TaxID=6319 RepID=A0AAN8ISE9_TRICO
MEKRTLQTKLGWEGHFAAFLFTRLQWCVVILRLKMSNYTNGVHSVHQQYRSRREREERTDPPLGTYIIPVGSSNGQHNSRVDDRRYEPEFQRHNGIPGPPQQGYRSDNRVMNPPNSRPSANDLEAKSKENRTLAKHSPFIKGDCVVMCRYNPTHILDVVNIDHHQRHCKDRRRLEEFGCSFRERYACKRVSVSVDVETEMQAEATTPFASLHCIDVLLILSLDEGLSVHRSELASSRKQLLEQNCTNCGEILLQCNTQQGDHLIGNHCWPSLLLVDIRGSRIHQLSAMFSVTCHCRYLMHCSSCCYHSR